jgi:hypothetical protein
MREGVRVPVEPFLVCEQGHVMRLPHTLHRGEVRAPDEDSGLIG